MDIWLWTTVAVRIIAAVVWTVLLYRLARRRDPSPFIRRLLILGAAVGFWTLAVSGLISAIGLDASVNRAIFTAFSTVSLLVGLVFLAERRL